MVFLGTSLKCGFESSELFPEHPNSAMQRSVDIHTVPVIKSKPPLSAHADGASGMLTWESLPRTLGIEEPRGRGGKREEQGRRPMGHTIYLHAGLTERSMVFLSRNSKVRGCQR